MALSVYTPTGIVHETSVDFTKRVLTEPVHLVQYDASLPVLEVSVYDAGQYLTLTASDTVSIRMDKKDGTFIYNPALGMSADGHIVYVQITLQMTANYGRFEPVIELLRDGGYGASSPIPMFIDKNPVSDEAIKSTSQWESLNDIVARANAIVADNAIEFTEAETRGNINSGETLITMLGKIKKWFTDLKAAAFCDVANNLITPATTTGLVLDARQGKALDEKYQSLLFTASTGIVDIKGYNSSSNFYLFPSDGYVAVDSGAGATAGTYIRFICKASNGTNAVLNYMNVTGSYQVQSVFVKKGMYGFLQGTNATNDYSITFTPLDRT